ncbi:proline rich transmembrane protein 1B-like [Anolis carolinensis]|uniref:proline rich transmembrane protein 1B-like n=1 Tax=Anolis carolinensis TaxID=28377 RepID=UPI000203A48B
MASPPPYSEKPKAWTPPPPSAPPMGPVRPGPAPPPYPPYYGPHGVVYNQGPILHQPQPIFIAAIHRVDEPDYMMYSLFTMLCCCLPIGIVAMIFSCKTRSANNAGDVRSARQYSTVALACAHTALGVGILIMIFGIILRLILAKKTPQYNP